MALLRVLHASALFILASCGSVAGRAAVTCLPAAIQEAERVNISAHGASMPLGVVQYLWSLNYVESSIYTIIVEEVLGLRTSLHTASTSAPGIYYLAGCSCATCAKPSCGAEGSEVHIMIGAWQSSMFATEKLVRETFPSLAPERLGEVGYHGSDGQWILEETRQRVFQVLEQAIDYYRAYNTSHDLTQFFTGLQEIPEERMMSCNLTVLATQPPTCQSYLALTGDSQGVVMDGDGGCRASCYGGRWWLSPTCRQEPRRCIPWITAGRGYSIWSMLQKASFHGMPLAVGVAGSYSDYLSLPVQYRMLFYWWFPDHSFASSRPVEIIFPPHNKEQFSVGDFRSASSADPIVKYAWNGLRDAHGLRARVVARKFEVNEDQAMLLVQKYDETMSRGGLTGPEAGWEVACGWLRENRVRWSAWLPLETECLEGQGLSKERDFVASRDEASGCTWCSAGRYSEPLIDGVGKTYICLPCPAGQEQPEPGQAKCSRCRPGHYKAHTGAELCQECPPGNATALEGQLNCPACLPGRAASEPAQLTCQSCAVGTAAPDLGSLTCSLCDSGTYADQKGSPNCSACESLLASSTSIRGASQAEECVCPEGRYMVASKGCVPCVEGLNCSGGNEEPWQRAGFWVDEAYTIYRCRDALQCPAGPLGTCAPGRQGLACNNCQNQHYPSGAGQCLPCQASSVAPVAACLVVMLAVFAMAVLFMRMDASRQHLSVLTALLIAGQLVTTLQALSAVRQLQIVWPEHIQQLLEVLGVLVFDPEWLRLPCLISADRPISKFALTLFSYPIFLALLVAVCFMSKLMGRPVDRLVALNFNGMFLMVVYISMTLTVMLPFQCQQNPSGFLSMATNPGIRCFDNAEHTALAALAAVGILAYPLGIAAWVAHATLAYRLQARTMAGVQLLRRFRFLFGRFKPECYYFGLASLFRNCLVVLIPILLVQVPVVQIVAMAMAFILSSGCHVWFKPWRTPLANVTDMALNDFLLLMLVCVALLADDVSKEMTLVIDVGLILFLVVILLGLLAVLTMMAVRRMRPKKDFGIFLCHHKAGAGSLCRLMKMLLTSQTSCVVFLDSDHLDDLDTLFDTVRSSVANLVVILSQKVLTRPWCAGEMATAYSNGVPMVPIVCDDFEKPDAQALQTIMRNWSAEEAAMLLRFDVGPEMIAEAQLHLMAHPSMQLQRLLPLGGKEAAMAQLVAMCHLPKAFRPMSPLPTPSSATADVVITGLVSNPERLAACEIMQMGLQWELEDLEVRIAYNRSEAAAALPEAKVLLVLWAGGLLQEPEFAEIALQASTQEGLHLLTAVSDGGFQFPTADFLAQMEERALPGLATDQGPALAAAYRRLLAVLSRPFDPLRSQTAIKEQIHELAVRVRTLLAGPSLSSKLSRSFTAMELPAVAAVSPTLPASPREGGTSQWSQSRDSI